MEEIHGLPELLNAIPHAFSKFVSVCVAPKDAASATRFTCVNVVVVVAGGVVVVELVQPEIKSGAMSAPNNRMCFGFSMDNNSIE